MIGLLGFSYSTLDLGLASRHKYISQVSLAVAKAICPKYYKNSNESCKGQTISE